MGGGGRQAGGAEGELGRPFFNWWNRYTQLLPHKGISTP